MLEGRVHWHLQSTSAAVLCFFIALVFSLGFAACCYSFHCNGEAACFCLPTHDPFFFSLPFFFPPVSAIDISSPCHFSSFFLFVVLHCDSWLTCPQSCADAVLSVCFHCCFFFFLTRSFIPFFFLMVNTASIKADLQVYRAYCIPSKTKVGISSQ